MKLFVGGLQYDMQESVIRDEFEKFGTVGSVELIPDRRPGNNKGFGYIEMPNEDEAARAISELNGIDFNGKKLKVAIAEDREPREPKERK